MSLIKLEICCFTLASCQVAQQSGADRIELCANPAEGGTTPSYGFIEAARKLLTIDLYPIIRPRGGDFLFDKEELDMMERDIAMCKTLGCDGVVVGMLDQFGQVDPVRLARLVSLAYPMEVTFHRAFDRAADPFAALEAIILSGCTRVLTSGQRPTAVEGVALLGELVRRADERIVVMPGSGLRSDNLDQVVAGSGAREFHTTARVADPSRMQFINTSMQEALDGICCSAQEIMRIRGILDQCIIPSGGGDDVSD